MKKLKKIPLIAIVIIIVLTGVVVLSVVSMFLSDKMDDERYERELKKSFSEIEYTVPGEFINTYEYNYRYDEDDCSCSIYFNSSKKYDDLFEDWFKGQIYLDLSADVSEQEEIDVNGNKALHIDVKNKYSYRRYYGFESSNYYYIVEFNIYDSKHGDGTENSECYSSVETVLNSIKIK